MFILDWLRGLSNITRVVIRIGVVALVALALIVLTIKAVRADRIDRIESMQVEDSCTVKTNMVSDGIVARGRHFTVDQWIDSVEDYVRQTQEFHSEMTPAEREYTAGYISHGWKLADRRIANKIKEANENEVGEFKGLIADLPMQEMLNPKWIEDVVDDYYGSCVMQLNASYDTGITRVNFVTVQSEELRPVPINTYGLWNSVTACMLNRGKWFHDCRLTNQKEVQSEADIGQMIKKCEQVVVQKFYKCTGLYPKGDE